MGSDKPAAMVRVRCNHRRGDPRPLGGSGSLFYPVPHYRDTTPGVCQEYLPVAYHSIVQPYVCGAYSCATHMQGCLRGSDNPCYGNIEASAVPCPFVLSSLWRRRWSPNATRDGYHVSELPPRAKWSSTNANAIDQKQ